MGRREQQRENTREEIKAIARELMSESGTSGIAMRKIADKMGVSPTALYRYYENLSALITALIADAFNALADALEIARDHSSAQDHSGKLLDVALAYRQWALDNPTDFQLIYGNPIPGFSAPREVTVPAVIRGFVVLVGLCEAALRTGEVHPLPYPTALPPTVAQHLQQLIQQDGYLISLTAMHMGIVMWTRMHGIIMLELFNHLGPTVGDVEAFYQHELQQMLTPMTMLS